MKWIALRKILRFALVQPLVEIRCSHDTSVAHESFILLPLLHNDFLRVTPSLPAVLLDDSPQVAQELHT